MSDAELLRLRVRVQRALTSLSRPRTQRSRLEVVAALEEIEAALVALGTD